MDLLIKELETRLDNVFNIKFSFAEGLNCPTVRVNLLGSLLYLFDEAFKLNDLEILCGGQKLAKEMIKSQEDENVKRHIKTSLIQLKSFLNRAGLGHLVSHSNILIGSTDTSRFVRIVSTLMDNCELRHGNLLITKVRQLSAKIVQQAVKKPTHNREPKSLRADNFTNSVEETIFVSPKKDFPVSRREIPRTPVHLDQKETFKTERQSSLLDASGKKNIESSKLGKALVRSLTPEPTQEQSSKSRLNKENILASVDDMPIKSSVIKITPERKSNEVKNVIPTGSQLLRTPFNDRHRDLGQNIKPSDNTILLSPEQDAIPSEPKPNVENFLKGISKSPILPLKNVIPSGNCLPRTPFHKHENEEIHEKDILNLEKIDVNPIEKVKVKLSFDRIRQKDNNESQQILTDRKRIDNVQQILQENMKVPQDDDYFPKSDISSFASSSRLDEQKNIKHVMETNHVEVVERPLKLKEKKLNETFVICPKEPPNFLQSTDSIDHENCPNDPEPDVAKVDFDSHLGVTNRKENSIVPSMKINFNAQSNSIEEPEVCDVNAKTNVTISRKRNKGNKNRPIRDNDFELPCSSVYTSKCNEKTLPGMSENIEDIKQAEEDRKVQHVSEETIQNVSGKRHPGQVIRNVEKFVPKSSSRRNEASKVHNQDQTPAPIENQQQNSADLGDNLKQKNTEPVSHLITQSDATLDKKLRFKIRSKVQAKPTNETIETLADTGSESNQRSVRKNVLSVGLHATPLSTSKNTKTLNQSLNIRGRKPKSKLVVSTIDDPKMVELNAKSETEPDNLHTDLILESCKRAVRRKQQVPEICPKRCVPKTASHTLLLEESSSASLSGETRPVRSSRLKAKTYTDDLQNHSDDDVNKKTQKSAVSKKFRKRGFNTSGATTFLKMEERCSFYPEIASESNQINEAPTKSPAVLEEDKLSYRSRPRRACVLKNMMNSTIAEELEPLNFHNQQSNVEDFMYNTPKFPGKHDNEIEKKKASRDGNKKGKKRIAKKSSLQPQNCNVIKDSKIVDELFENPSISNSSPQVTDQSSMLTRPRRACASKKMLDNTIAEIMQPLVLSGQQGCVDDNLYKTPKAIKVPVLQKRAAPRRNGKLTNKLKRKLDDEVGDIKVIGNTKNLHEKVIIDEIFDEILSSSS